MAEVEWFAELLKETLSGVGFFVDYVQLHFNLNPLLNIYTPVVVAVNGTNRSSGQPEFANALIGQIRKASCGWRWNRKTESPSISATRRPCPFRRGASVPSPRRSPFSPSRGCTRSEDLLLVDPLVDRQPLEVDRLTGARAFVPPRGARAPVKARIAHAVHVDEPSLQAHVVAFLDARDGVPQPLAGGNDVRVRGMGDDRAAVERGVFRPPEKEAGSLAVGDLAAARAALRRPPSAPVRCSGAWTLAEPVGTAHGFNIGRHVMRWILKNDSSPGRFEKLPADTMLFWYPLRRRARWRRRRSTCSPSPRCG